MLSENEAVEIISMALATRVRGASPREYIKHAKDVYVQLAPHLSETSAEKARVEGLAAFAQKIASEGFYGAMNDPNDLVKILDEHKDGADKALAAFEGE